MKQQEIKLGPNHPGTRACRINLEAARQLKRCAESYELARTKKGAEHAETLEAWNKYAWQLSVCGRWADAAAEYRRLLAAGLRAFRAGNSRAEQWAIDYCQFVVRTSSADAEAAADARAILGDNPSQPALVAQMLAICGLNLLGQKQFNQAEPLLRACLALRQKDQPDDWATFNTQSMLGEALLGQKKYADAGPLLLQGYEGMKQREAKIPPQGKMRLSEALQRLVQLYEATDKKDEAARWRKEWELAAKADSPDAAQK